jgi:hypothetical protein
VGYFVCSRQFHCFAAEEPHRLIERLIPLASIAVVERADAKGATI